MNEGTSEWSSLLRYKIGRFSALRLCCGYSNFMLLSMSTADVTCSSWREREREVKFISIHITMNTGR